MYVELKLTRFLLTVLLVTVWLWSSLEAAVFYQEQTFFFQSTGLANAIL
jgi:hypothetical protein